MVTSPRVSFGLAVRNGEQFIRRAIDSVLGQTLQDFELVISDNASTDKTPEICRAYAQRDARILFFQNEKDAGQIINHNRVFQLSRGEYFRWIGVDDWLEREYAERCVEMLDAHPELVAATTYFDITDQDGNVYYRPFEGPFVESPEAHERFARMLWFYYAGDAVWDQLYGMIRRSALEQTALIRMMEWADWMLCAELALIGAFANVPERLAHRYKDYRLYSNRADIDRRYHPEKYRQVRSSPFRLVRVLTGIVFRARLAVSQRMACLAAIARFGRIHAQQRAQIRFRHFVVDRLGITRSRLRLVRERLGF